MFPKIGNDFAHGDRTVTSGFDVSHTVSFYSVFQLDVLSQEGRGVSLDTCQDKCCVSPFGGTHESFSVTVQWKSRTGSPQSHVQKYFVREGFHIGWVYSLPRLF